MAGRFSRSLELAKASWSVIKADKELLWFPVMSAVALALIITPIVLFDAPAFSGYGEPSPLAWLALLAGYVLCYFVGLFFNTALVGAAMIRLDGGDPTLADGLRIAQSRVGQIFGYACIAGTVGVLLHLLEERVGWLGQIAVRLIGVAWAVATFLVVPVLVARDIGPVDAVRESAGLLRRTWGENIIGGAGLGFVFGVACVAVVVVAGLSIALALQANLAVLVPAILVTGVVGLVLLATLHATMHGVYAAALYRYATAGEVPPAGTGPGFAPEILQQAFRPRA